MHEQAGNSQGWGRHHVACWLAHALSPRCKWAGRMLLIDECAWPGWRLAKDEDKIFMALLARHCPSWEHLNPENSLVFPIGDQDDKVKMRMAFSEEMQV